MTPKQICTGTRTMTSFADAQATCPVCKRVKRTNANGRIVPHWAPAYCEALVYHNRWPDSCSRKAIEGSRFCRQHTPKQRGPIHDCASLGGSHQPDCQLALARGTTLGQPGDFSSPLATAQREIEESQDVSGALAALAKFESATRSTS